MRTNTRDRIISYIQEYRQARPHELIGYLRLSAIAVHKQLKRLVAENILQKAGKPPLVYYTLSTGTQASEQKMPAVTTLPANLSTAINENFLSFTPDGKLLYGMEGFIYWKNLYQPDKSLQRLAEKYALQLSQRDQISSAGGWIDATKKLRDTFPEKYIDYLFYQDIYSYPLFGRTKLAKLVMYAKQSQNRELIDRIALLTKPVIERIIVKYHIEAIGFIPPTVPRALQFMSEFAAQLKIPLPDINLVKLLAGDIPVPQKTLSKLEERIINAQKTIFPRQTKGPSYKNILLIDDVTGSGSSFQETAKKLKAKQIGSNSIIAFAVVGNIKGYDVIKQI